MDDTAARLPTALALAGFLLAMFTAWGAESLPGHLAGLVAMPIALLFASWFQPITLHLVLMCVFAGTLPYFASAAVSLVTAVPIHFVLAGLVGERSGTDNTWLYSLTYLGFTVFSLFSSYSVMRERRAREELDRVHQELVAAGQLLAQRRRRSPGGPWRCTRST